MQQMAASEVVPASVEISPRTVNQEALSTRREREYGVPNLTLGAAV